MPRLARVGPIVALLAASATVLSAAPPAAAAPNGSATGSGSPADVRQVCSTPATGRLQCLAIARTDVRSHKGVVPDVTPEGYGPADLAGAYALPSSGGSEATVAVIDAYDDPNAEADLAVYRSQYGLPPCTTANGCFRKIAQDGTANLPAPPPPTDDWTAEISLDIDMVSAACPTCHILLVEADLPTIEDLGTAVNQAVAQGAQYVSNSYGGFEDPSDPEADTRYYDHPGVVITASSGDRNFGTSYPAASQFVTSVGGTSLTRDSGASRGWTETVWHNNFGGPGSGCAAFDEKPPWQTDAGCPRRSIADVSAVADPLTGVAAYDSWGGNTGWAVYGGTSASAPIVAATYALAGLPETGDYPASYPYGDTGDLNDVTVGNNGTFCDPSYLCVAGPGYDGPTGLGTPNGVAAFKAPGAHGVLAGTVTDAANGHPIPGATVRAGDGRAVSRADGHFAMAVPAGSYDVTASAFGYRDATSSGVQVSEGQTSTADFSLDPKPLVTLSGTVADGSGHQWPLSAKITTPGVPPVETDPFTGHYSLQVPASTAYTLHVEPQYPGYVAHDEQVSVGTSDARQDVALSVDAVACNAPGYAYTFQGMPPVPFDSTTGPPAGWTITDTQGTHGWTFDNPNNQANTTGGEGNFAVVPQAFLGVTNHEDTTLTTPSIDLSAIADPSLGLDEDYIASNTQTASIDVSTDGGATWTNLWQFAGSSGRIVQGNQTFDLSEIASGQPDVRARFQFTSFIGQSYWAIDNVFLGARACAPVPGGLVAGQVLDANTSKPLGDATVTRVDAPAETARTDAGFYWMFASATGSQQYAAAHRAYSTRTSSVEVAPNSVKRADFSLAAGQLTTSTAAVDKTLRMGSSATASFTVKNTGTAPAAVSFDEAPDGFATLGQQASGTGAELQLVEAAPSTRTALPPGSSAPPADVRRSDVPSSGPWTDLPDAPGNVMDNAAVRGDDGKLYSVAGTTSGFTPTGNGYAYDPATRAWSPIADVPTPVQQPAAAFIDGKLILAGGWSVGGVMRSTVQIYDPASDTWKAGAAMPHPHGAAAYGVLNGKLYVVGGCTDTCAAATSTVDVYDPATNAWRLAADYPEKLAYFGCGSVNGRLACAGGTPVVTNTGSTSTYIYDPHANAWTKSADLPYDVWGAAFSSANGQLLISGGAADDSHVVTNQGVAFSMTGSDPATGTWAALPNSNNAAYRGAGACGFGKVGGAATGFDPTPFAEELPGYDQCGADPVAWLSATPAQATLQPGQTVTVHVTLDASDIGVIDQPGTYLARLGLQADTPYWVNPVAVSMTANPPKTWGKIAGTVTGRTCDGNSAPILGGTVQIGSWAQTYTLKTDSAGGYALWLDKRSNPLTVIAAKDGFVPQARTVRISQGDTLTASFALVHTGC